MALNNKHKVWESLIKKTLLIGAIAAVIVFNVCKFLQYAETNDRFVKNYASKQDALADYRNPLPAVFYFTSCCYVSCQSQVCGQLSNSSSCSPELLPAIRRPKCLYASSVTIRPRGVRLMNPSMIR